MPVPKGGGREPFFCSIGYPGSTKFRDLSPQGSRKIEQQPSRYAVDPKFSIGNARLQIEPIALATLTQSENAPKLSIGIPHGRAADPVGKL